MFTQIIAAEPVSDFPCIEEMDKTDEALELLEELVKLTDKTQVIIVKV